MPGRTPDDRTWTHGQRDSTLRIHRLESRPKAAKLGDPTPEILRDCIKDGYCWWCGRGGWKALSIHTYHAHGISANDIRDMAGLFYHIPTCLPGLSHQFSVNIKSQLDNGIRTMPSSLGHRHKMKFSKAGRKYQDEVKTAILLANSSDEQRRAANKIASEKTRKPHPCPVCGKIVRVSIKRRATCSPECRKIIRQQTGVASMQTIKRLSEENPEYRLKINLKLSESMKKQFRKGRQPYQIKPHSCRICGKMIPYATPRLCSEECRHKARQEAQLKAVVNRTLKIPKTDHAIIATRFQSGESSSVIAKEYSISPRYVRLIGVRHNQNRKDKYDE